MRSMRSVVGILGCVLAVAANGSAQVSQVVAGEAVTAAGINAIVDAVNAATTNITDIYGELGGTPSGNLNLDASTASTGNVLKDGVRFLHNYGTNNTFVGSGAGNFPITSEGNTANGRVDGGSGSPKHVHHFLRHNVNEMDSNHPWRR